MNRRLRVLLHWLAGRRQGVTLSELLSFVVRPTIGPRARRVIDVLEESGFDLEVRLQGLSRPLYWPREIPSSSLHQVISEAFYPDDWHYYELDETRVRGGEIIADCGAAKGLFSLLAADRARKIYAIEPVPRFVAAMRRTFRDLSNVEILQCALGDKPGTARLGCRSPGDNPGRAVRRPRRTDYLHKADLEGHDLSALRGGATLIEEHRPRIAITTYHHPQHAAEIERLLRRIEPKYRVRTKGIFQVSGCPVMLHAWVD